MIPKRPATLQTLAVLLAIVPFLLGGSCLRRDRNAEGEFYIPDQETAIQQLHYANMIRQSTYPSVDQEKRAEQMEKIIQGYQKVVDRFPDDRVATPEAKVTLGMLYARTPIYKDKALRTLAEVERDYPDIDYVLAPALYNQGLLYDQARLYEQAQIKYREVFERWGASPNPKLKEYARLSRDRYNRIRPRQ